MLRVNGVKGVRLAWHSGTRTGRAGGSGYGGDWMASALPRCALAQRLRELREQQWPELRLTQAQLAKALRERRPGHGLLLGKHGGAEAPASRRGCRLRPLFCYPQICRREHEPRCCRGKTSARTNSPPARGWKRNCWRSAKRPEHRPSAMRARTEVMALHRRGPADHRVRPAAAGQDRIFRRPGRSQLHRTAVVRRSRRPHRTARSYPVAKSRHGGLLQSLAKG